ncbi:MAG: hypothetical protein IKA49_04860 [Alistipes sp.]|nr:hypothetical protein [Alistipes sp.]
MSVKVRLQRVLQIVEEAERKGELCDLERDIVLGELREAYVELKFCEVKSEEPQTKGVVAAEVPNTPVAPIAPIEEDKEEADEEPEVEVELIFDESDNEPEDECDNEVKEESEEPIISETPNAPNTPNTPIEPTEELASFVSHTTPKKSNPLLSLYEEGSKKEVLGESFHEKPSVADTIACPKGVAEMAHISSLRGAIGVADRFMLIRELFAGDEKAYDNAIESLDSIGSFDDCVIYIAENFEWQAQNEGTKLMMELLQRKFNA